MKLQVKRSNNFRHDFLVLPQKVDSSKYTSLPLGLCLSLNERSFLSQMRLSSLLRSLVSSIKDSSFNAIFIIDINFFLLNYFPVDSKIVPPQARLKLDMLQPVYKQKSFLLEN